MCTITCRRMQEEKMESNHFVGCTVKRNFDYSKKFRDSDLEDECKRQQSMHIVSKTHLDLFLPNSDTDQNLTNSSSLTNGDLTTGDLIQRPAKYKKRDPIGCNGEVTELTQHVEEHNQNGGKFENGHVAQTVKRKCQSTPESREAQEKGVSQRKVKTEPKNVENENNGGTERKKSSAPPLVVFAYGGGWRRGDKQAWRHYLSRWDTNFALAANVGRHRLYANVGESFACRGFPCAVLSYPLVPTPFPVNLLEMSISFMLTVALTFVLTLTLFLALEIMHLISFFESLAYIAWDILQSHTDFPLVTISIGVVLLAQMLSVAIVVSRERYIKTKSTANSQIDYKIVVIWRTVFIGICVLLISVLLWRNDSPAELQSNVKMTAIFVSGALILCVQYLLYQYQLLTTLQTSPSNEDSSNLVADPYGQAKCVARSLRWLVDYGQTTGHFDPTSIILVGHSAGGHLVSLVALDHHYLTDAGVSPNFIKGVITLSAVHDLHTISRGPFYPIYLEPAFGTDPAHWVRMSPITYVTDSRAADDTDQPRNDHKPRFLIISAERDFKIMIEDSTKMREVLRDNQYEVEHRFMHGCDHFQMMKQFGCPWHRYWFGVDHLESGWSPNAGEEMCWDFVRDIVRDQDAKACSS